MPELPGEGLLPGPHRRGAGDTVTGRDGQQTLEFPDLPEGRPGQAGEGRSPYRPGQLARLLGLPEPTAEQAAVIAAPLAPLAVIAGAGSGKSETMAARLVWLVANGMARPEQVLGLTFTRKAAAELGQRVRTRLAGLRRAGIAVTDGAVLDGEPVVSTYHAYASRIVADHALREALEPSLRLVTPAVAWQIATRAVSSYAGPMDAVVWSPPEVTAAVLALAGELAEHLRGPDDVGRVGAWLDSACQALPGRAPALVKKIIECQRAREQLLPLVSAYAEAKARREVMDYGDQVTLAARIATRHPEVGAAERARYQVVLLDEFQDTSHAQLVLLKALFGGGHPVTAVGDPCQSIYGWRGASAGNLRRFAQEFPVRRRDTSRSATVRMLATSFRNTERVLAAAAALQRGLRDEAPGVPRLAPPVSRADRGAVTCALLDNSADEARWVSRQIEQLLRLPPGTAPDGDPWPGLGPRQAVSVQPSDIAVLCRKRSQFPALRAAIEARGIPVEVVGLGGLLTVPEVADIVATLRVMHDPGASGSLARLLAGPRWRLGPRDLVALGRRARRLVSEQRRPGGAGAPGEPSVRHDDAIAEAVTDLTSDPGSLVEALDDPGDRGAYSPEGYLRLRALAAELRALQAHAGRPLPDLVGEVERVLGLDIEVAAQPWRDPAAARGDLDAFADAAAAFADDEEEPTLGAFLAYLAAAETEEFGLEAGQPSGANAVTLTTVHAAKGLQWPAVFVPGLAAGAKAQVFPAKPRVTTRWTENARLLPFGLRGDAADLPALAGLSAESLSAFADECAARELAEERRLAYVAVTRAAFSVACTGYWWGEATSPLGPSVFLEEVRAACEAGAGAVACWAPPPEEGADNPALAEPASALWPGEPGGARYEAVREAAALVEEALAGKASAGGEPAAGAPAGSAGDGAVGDLAGDGAVGDLAGDGAVGDLAGDGAAGGSRTDAPAGDAAAGVVPAGAVPTGAVPTGAVPTGAGLAGAVPAGAGLAEAGLAEAGSAGDERLLASAWARDADLLLAELADRRGDAGTAVWLPGRLSVSALVAMASDPARLAQEIRRPMPRPPAPKARRGTEFHRWLEERFGQQRLIDPADLLGAADEAADEADAADLSLLREQFEAGEWGNRWPADVEVPFETLIAGRTVRGRIDAVFADTSGGYDVVDWKTGQPPASAADFRAAAVQLAAYRLAWARLAGLPLDQVRAGFYYVRQDLTLRPADLLGEAGLAELIQGIPVAG
jgi:DNA helicase II / ATP-dependent DNA helicase PcrA